MGGLSGSPWSKAPPIKMKGASIMTASQYLPLPHPSMNELQLLRNYYPKITTNFACTRQEAAMPEAHEGCYLVMAAPAAFQKFESGVYHLSDGAIFEMP